MTLRTTTALERAALGTLFLTAGPCLAGPSPPAPSIVELRQYTLQPGSRDTFITLFEREFMVDSDNVLLLRVARPTSGFASDGGAGPPGASPIAAGLFVAHIHHFDRPVTAAFLDFFDAEVRPHLNAAGIPVLASLITEQTANNFPRLPVREGEQVFVWFSSFADQAASSARGTLSRAPPPGRPSPPLFVGASHPSRKSSASSRRRGRGCASLHVTISIFSSVTGRSAIAV